MANPEINSDAEASVDLLMADINSIRDPRKAGILAFHQTIRPALLVAKGSAHKHQPWPGGYVDHIRQCFQLAERHYRVHDLPDEAWPFALESAKIVLLFHDIEKPFKHVPDYLVDPSFNKDAFLYKILPARWGVQFTPEEINALTYIHGEGNEHNPETRIMGPLAVFVHCMDTLSARVFFNRGVFRPDPRILLAQGKPLTHE